MRSNSAIYPFLSFWFCDACDWIAYTMLINRCFHTDKSIRNCIETMSLRGISTARNAFLHRANRFWLSSTEYLSELLLLQSEFSSFSIIYFLPFIFITKFSSQSLISFTDVCGKPEWHYQYSDYATRPPCHTKWQKSTKITSRSIFTIANTARNQTAEWASERFERVKSETQMTQPTIAIQLKAKLMVGDLFFFIMAIECATCVHISKFTWNKEHRCE